MNIVKNTTNTEKEGLKKRAAPKKRQDERAQKGRPLQSAKKGENVGWGNVNAGGGYDDCGGGSLQH